MECCLPQGTPSCIYKFCLFIWWISASLQVSDNNHSLFLHICFSSPANQSAPGAVHPDVERAGGRGGRSAGSRRVGGSRGGGRTCQLYPGYTSGEGSHWKGEWWVNAACVFSVVKSETRNVFLSLIFCLMVFSPSSSLPTVKSVGFPWGSGDPGLLCLREEREPGSQLSPQPATGRWLNSGRSLPSCPPLLPLLSSSSA